MIELWTSLQYSKRSGARLSAKGRLTINLCSLVDLACLLALIELEGGSNVYGLWCFMNLVKFLEVFHYKDCGDFKCWVTRFSDPEESIRH